MVIDGVRVVGNESSRWRDIKAMEKGIYGNLKIIVVWIE